MSIYHLSVVHQKIPVNEMFRPAFNCFFKDSKVEEYHPTRPHMCCGIRKTLLAREISLEKRSTSKTYEGGQWIEVEAPLDVIPVFFKGNEKLF